MQNVKRNIIRLQFLLEVVSKSIKKNMNNYILKELCNMFKIYIMLKGNLNHQEAIDIGNHHRPTR